MAKNIGSIQLCKLGQILKIDTYESLMNEFSLVGELLPDGPWPETLPSKLVEKLRAIPDEEIIVSCAKWAQIDIFDNTVPPDSLIEYIQELREFLSSNTGPFFLVNGL